jgi:hypothetical protein
MIDSPPDDPTLAYAASHDACRIAIERLAEFAALDWVPAADKATIQSMIKMFHATVTAERFDQLTAEATSLENALQKRLDAMKATR